MFKKGRKREAKGLAVVYFIIGLIILLIILAVVYFALVELDYSDRIRDPEATIRSYVETTSEPDEPENDDEFYDDFDSALDVDLTVEVTPTPEPSPTPTPTPEPTPTPSPTPEPTPIPKSMLSKSRTSGFSVPAFSSPDMEAGITKCYVSVPDDSKYMYLAGYGFLNNANYDASGAQLFVVVSQAKTGKKIAYQTTKTPGASGITHDSAPFKNPEAADFEVYIDVSSKYKDDIYTIGVVTVYRPAGSKQYNYAYYELPKDVSFTVASGKVVTPVNVPDLEADAAVAEMVSADDAEFDESAFEDFGTDSEFDSGVDDIDFEDSEEEPVEETNTNSSINPNSGIATTVENGITSVEQLYYDQMTTG